MEETRDVYFMGARTEWLCAEQFNDINNWDDSLKPSASRFIEHVDEWIASRDECAKGGDDVTHTLPGPVKPKENGVVSVIKTTNLFACTQCGKTFSRRGYLNQHNRVHSGEKPYVWF